MYGTIFTIFTVLYLRYLRCYLTYVLYLRFLRFLRFCPQAPILRVEILELYSIRIAGVACGADHMFAFGVDGLYAWGSGTNGQLGIGDDSNRNRPTLVSDIDQVKHIACGQLI